MSIYMNPQEYKFGPMLGKRVVTLADLTEDYISEHEGRPHFTITIFQLAQNGVSTLNYIDALGYQQSENFTAIGQVVTGGPPGSAHPIPMFCQTIQRTGSTVRKVQVAW